MTENNPQPEVSGTKKTEATDKDQKKAYYSYPAKPFNDIYSFVEKIYTVYGGNNYHTNIDVAAAVNLAAATIKSPLSTAQQYGLLELKYGTGYKVTPLFINICLWDNESVRQANIIESLRKPEIFAKLFNDYTGQIVPAHIGIKNRLMREFEFPDKIADSVASTFLQNLQDYNLLNARNVLLISSPLALSRNNQETTSEEPTVTHNIDEKPPARTETAVIIPDDFVEILIPLKSSQHNARLIVPRNYTAEDLARISKFVAALE